MSTPRRDFLSWLGAGGLYAAAGIPAIPQGHRTIASPPPVTDKWDMSWVDRVNGKYRAVFDSPAVSEGAALFRAILWRDQYKEVYGTTVTDTNAVVVFRHMAIPLVMNDEYWRRFEVGKELKLKNPATKKWTTVNPIRASAPGTPPQFAGYDLGNFVATGGIVLACNLAFGEIVGRFTEADKLSAADARKKAIDNLVPGVILQPSGGFAVLRAQEAGCHFMMGS